LDSVLPQQRLLQAERTGGGAGEAHVVVPRRRAREQLARRGPVSEVEEEVGEVEQRVVGVVQRRCRRWRGGGGDVVGGGAGVRATVVVGAGCIGGRCREVRGGGERGGGLDVLGRGGGRARELARELREVEVRGAALDRQRGHVVGARRHLGGGEGAEPDARLLAGLPDLRHPLAPGPHAHAAVRRVVPVLGAPPLLAVAARGGGGVGGRRGRGRGSLHGGRRGGLGLGAGGRVVHGHGSSRLVRAPACVGGVGWQQGASSCLLPGGE